jgi:hypothetical protein
MSFKKPHPLYTVWQSMKRRCDSPKNRAYHRYGGRGITVCERWLHDFHAFVADMGERPKGTSIDRIDNDKGYSPENCRWSTRAEQQLNRECVKKVFIEGKQYFAHELSKISGVKTDTIINRVERGLPYNEVISSQHLRNLDGFLLGAEISAKKRKSKTHCKRGHEYDEANLHIDKAGAKQCKKCRAMRERERNAFKRLILADQVCKE